MIGRFSSNFIKYLAMGLAFALISFLFKSCEVNAQPFSPTYRGVEVINSSGKAISWSDSVVATGRNGITFYSFQKNNEAYAHGYRFKISNDFHWNFGKSVVSGYAFCQYHTETGMDLYGCDSISLVSEELETVSCSIEQEEQVTRFVCNSTPNFVVDYVQLNMSYPADPYSITGVGGMSIDPDTNQAIVDSNKEIKDGVDKGNQIQQDTNDTIKSDDVDTSSSNSFFNNFKSSDHGLTGIVSAPLKLINQFTTTTCKSVNIDFLGAKADLPCGSTLWGREDLKTFVDIYNVIMGGLISYGAVKGIFKKVQDFKNPDNSKVEVIDL